MTKERPRLPRPVRRKHKLQGLPKSRWLLVAAIVALLLYITGSLLAAQLGREQAQSETGQVVQERDQAAEKARNLGDEVVEACARGDVVQSANGQNLCQRAAALRSDPVVGAAGPSGEPGRPPTAAEIEAAVDGYCAARNECTGPGPTTAQVAAAVAEHMLAHPPMPGRPPTAAEIASAVQTYFATNPPPPGPQGQQGPRGEEGKAGERGPGPTSEEIAAAVSDWLSANPPPAGPRGPAGPTCPEGTSLQPVEFASGERGLGCVSEQAPDPDPVVTTTPPPPTDSDEPMGEG